MGSLQASNFCLFYFCLFFIFYLFINNVSVRLSRNLINFINSKINKFLNGRIIIFKLIILKNKYKT